MTATSAHNEGLAGALRGDDAALTALVRLHHDRVYRFGLRVCRDGFDADDAVQEAFSKLARRPDVMADRAALAWLFSVVRHACMKLLSPWRRERPVLGERDEDVDIPSRELSPEAALERWELVRSVHAALATLSPELRAVLVLRDLEGLSGPETCAALDLQPAAMKSRLHRARSQLRQCIRRI